MSTTPLRIAEVEARLHLVRHRLNWFAAQHVVYLGLSVVAVGATALVIAGLRAPAHAFRATLWTVLAAALVTAAACVYVLASRWYDLPRTAALTDRRSALRDRLTTLVSLRTKPQPSPLAPLLATQALDLRSHWRPESVVPRGLPRSVFVLLASLALLASTALIERRRVEGFATEHTDGTTAKAEPQPAGRISRPQPRYSARDDVGGREWSDDNSDRSGSAQFAGHAGTIDGQGTYGGSPSAEANAGGELPDRIQDAIRQAFRAQPMDRARPLGTASESDSSRGRGSRGEREGERGEAPGAPAAERRSRRDSPPQSSEDSQTARDRDLEGGKRGKRIGDDAGRGGERSGASTGAGDGPGSDPPLGTRPDLGASDGEPTRFKLTISSFLAAVENRGSLQWNKGAASQADPASGEASRNLSDRQLDDDAMRKPEVPQQYEDVVRRTFSAGK